MTIMRSSRDVTALDEENSIIPRAHKTLDMLQVSVRRRFAILLTDIIMPLYDVITDWLFFALLQSIQETLSSYQDHPVVADLLGLDSKLRALEILIIVCAVASTFGAVYVATFWLNVLRIRHRNGCSVMEAIVRSKPRIDNSEAKLLTKLKLVGTLVEDCVQVAVSFLAMQYIGSKDDFLTILNFSSSVFSLCIVWVSTLYTFLSSHYANSTVMNPNRRIYAMTAAGVVFIVVLAAYTFEAIQVDDLCTGTESFVPGASSSQFEALQQCGSFSGVILIENDKGLRSIRRDNINEFLSQYSYIGQNQNLQQISFQGIRSFAANLTIANNPSLQAIFIGTEDAAVTYDTFGQNSGEAESKPSILLSINHNPSLITVVLGSGDSAYSRPRSNFVFHDNDEMEFLSLPFPEIRGLISVQDNERLTNLTFTALENDFFAGSFLQGGGQITANLSVVNNPSLRIIDFVSSSIAIDFDASTMTISNNDALETVSLPTVTNSSGCTGGITVSNCSSLTSVAFLNPSQNFDCSLTLSKLPSVTEVTMDNFEGYHLQESAPAQLYEDMEVLTTMSFTGLEFIYGNFEVINMPVLTLLDLSGVRNIGAERGSDVATVNMTLEDLPLLTSINMSSVDFVEGSSIITIRNVGLTVLGISASRIQGSLFLIDSCPDLDTVLFTDEQGHGVELTESGKVEIVDNPSLEKIEFAKFNGDIAPTTHARFEFSGNAALVNISLGDVDGSQPSYTLARLLSDNIIQVSGAHPSCMIYSTSPASSIACS